MCIVGFRFGRYPVVIVVIVIVVVVLVVIVDIVEVCSLLYLSMTRVPTSYSCVYWEVSYRKRKTQFLESKQTHKN